LVITYLLILLAGILLGGLIQSKRTLTDDLAGTCIEKGLVDNVIDGDTIVLRDGRTIRYLGINAPETHHPTKGVECYGSEATERNKALASGKKIILECGLENMDEYGRYLRYVFVDDIFVNAELVQEGYATAFPYGKTEKFEQVFVQLENYSRMQNKGLWKACPHIN
jgi:micrococcal nuclease